MDNKENNMIEEALKLIKHYNLGLVNKWILEHNTSLALPYHSYNHSLYVMCNAYNCWTYEKSDDDYDAIRAMLLGALFHDFGHSGGLFHDDMKNTRLAQEAVMQLAFDESFRLNKRGGQRFQVEGICGIFLGILIEKLKYPHEPLEDLCEGIELHYSINCLAGKHRSFTQEECTLMVNCLRDADLMQNCNETILNNFIGIKHESFRHLRWEEYYQLSVEFLSGLKYNTAYGKKVGKPLLNHAVKQLKQFGKLLGLDK